MIDLETARQIAYAWHGGQWSPLYSFASTSNDGQPRNISSATVAECHHNAAEALAQSNKEEWINLMELSDYLYSNLPPVEHTCPNGHAYQRQPGTVETCQVCGEPLQETPTPTEETTPNTDDYGFGGLVGDRPGYRVPPGYIHEQDE